MASSLGDDDAFLVGLDLVKDVASLETAYNDCRGHRGVHSQRLDRRQPRARGDVRAGAIRVRGPMGPAREWMDIGFALEAGTRSRSGLGTRRGLPGGRSASSRDQREVPPRDRSKRSWRAPGLRPESWWTDAAGGYAVALASAPRREEIQMSAARPICTHLDQIEVTGPPGRDRGLRGVPEDR